MISRRISSARGAKFRSSSFFDVTRGRGCVEYGHFGKKRTIKNRMAGVKAAFPHRMRKRRRRGVGKLELFDAQFGGVEVLLADFKQLMAFLEFCNHSARGTSPVSRDSMRVSRRAKASS